MTCFSEEKVCENKTIHLISRSFPLPNFLLENMHMGLDVSWREGSGASHSLWLRVSPALEAVSFSPQDGVVSKLARGLSAPAGL